jgi:hypothetical protein
MWFNSHKLVRIIIKDSVKAKFGGGHFQVKSEVACDGTERELIKSISEIKSGNSAGVGSLSVSWIPAGAPPQIHLVQGYGGAEGTPGCGLKQGVHISAI